MTAQAFRRLIDSASARQVRACHPNFERFLDCKRRFDPRQRFQSNWYRHCRDLRAFCPAELAA